VLGQHLLWLDVPEHPRLRHLLHKAFAPQTLADLQPFLQQQADHLFDGIETGGEVDVINEFAYPLLATLIVSLLGLPPESTQQLIACDKAAGVLFDAGIATSEQFDQAWRDTAQCIQWLQQLVTEEYTYPQNTLIQLLLDARQRGDICSEEELLAYCYLLIIAGFGTTANSFGLGLLALLQHPAQLEAWRQDPYLTPSATEELFRYSSTVQTTSRFVLQDLEIGNKTIRAGQRLILCLGAANRDPAQFSDPQQLHLRRAPNPHLTFAPGIHHCLGVPLARFQLPLMFTALLRRFPEFRLATTSLSYYPGLTFRALERLPIFFG
jgi:cytochrome P450